MQIVDFFMLGLSFKGITASQYILIKSKLFVKKKSMNFGLLKLFQFGEII